MGSAYPGKSIKIIGFHYADDVLRAAMKEAGVGCIKRTILYCGSRWLGGCLFRKRDERIFAR